MFMSADLYKAINACLKPVKDDLAKVDDRVKAIMAQLDQIEKRVKALSTQLVTIEEAVKQKPKA
jgi:septal ring factor EnvC (AmiA/AmiB activator)